MVDSETYALLREGLRVLFLIGLPIVVAAMIAGVLSGIFQGSTLITDPAVGYTLRLLAVVGVIALVMTTGFSLLQNLLVTALSS
ncbi:MAG: flagellar biosynthetic protein FliQ [Bdellovibrionota bacterium]|nr:MAG: flagellar biosynthetic protein FliQ [Bdellovibrionota bacterium]